MKLVTFTSHRICLSRSSILFPTHPVTAALDIVGPSGLHSSRVEVQDRLADNRNMSVECNPYRHDVSGSVYASAIGTRDVNHLGGERRVLSVRSLRTQLEGELAS